LTVLPRQKAEKPCSDDTRVKQLCILNDSPNKPCL